MDSQAQLHRTHAHHQAEEPTKIHHPEEGEHHEKGPSKVLKKVKEKAKKIKNVLTKHGHSHEHDRGAHIPDEEDDEDEKVHGGAPARGKANIPVKEEITPPGTKAFPVCSHTKHSDPTRGAGSGVPEKEERRVAPPTLTPYNTPTFNPGEQDKSRVNIERPKGLEQDTAAPGSHGPSGMSNYQSKVTDPTGKSTGEIGAASTVSALGRLGLGTDLQKKGHGHGLDTKSNTPGSDGGMSNYPSKVTHPAGRAGEDQLGMGRDVRERSHGFDTKSVAPGSHGGISNYPSKVTHPAAGEDDQLGLGRDIQERSHGFDTKSAAPGSHGGMPNYPSKVTHPAAGEDDQLGLGRDVRERSHGFDTKSGTEIGKHVAAGNYGSGLRSDEFDSGKATRSHEGGDEMKQPNQSSYTDKIASATAVVADKAMAAKNAVAWKLGYSGEGGEQNRVEGEETPSSGGGYGSKVTEIVTPVYEKAKETGANMVSKLPFTGSGTGSASGMEQGQDKGVSTREYLTEKLSPGEEDKVLSEVVTEKLHLGGEPVKKGTVTQSEEVERRLGGFKDPSSEAAIKHGKAYAEEGEGGMVEKLQGAVTSWLAGTTEEVTQKSTESVQDSSQSLGSSVGNKIGIPGSGGDDKSGSVPLQGRFKESGN